MKSLAINLGIIFGFQLLLNPLNEIISTFIKYKIRIFTFSKLYSYRNSPIIEEYFLVPVRYA